MSSESPSPHLPSANSLDGHPTDVLSRLVQIFLESNLSTILIIASLLLGIATLMVTPREEDPQIVVPLADIYVQFPGHSATEVEQLVATPLERMLYQIDGVEYVYSMSQADQAIITVRFFVGQDRERSLVKLFKKLQENLDQVSPGVTGWIMKPVEIDDVPIVTLTLCSHELDGRGLRRLGEELVERLSAVPNVSRAYVVGGEPRVVQVEIDSERAQGYQLSLLEITNSVRGANTRLPAGRFTRDDNLVAVEAGRMLTSAGELNNLVVGVFQGTPVFLKDVAKVRDGSEEVATYVRHGWGAAQGFAAQGFAAQGFAAQGFVAQGFVAQGFVAQPGNPGTVIGQAERDSNGTAEFANTLGDAELDLSTPAVTIAVAKQKGSNAVSVAKNVLAAAELLRNDIVPHNAEMVITRNFGLTADEKVSELIEALGVAILIVLLLLTLSMGWREAFVVAVAVPVVFGLTLAINWLAGYTINRVTLFALILSLGLLVDDPIVDVENIARHFEERGKANRDIVLQAVAEIRPPLISATLAVIVSFLPLFFITGMMGPYMSPMALNVPVAMLMSMLVAFTITPWLSYVVLRRRFARARTGESSPASARTENSSATAHDLYDIAAVQRSLLYRLFRPLMAPLLATKGRALAFLFLMAGLTAAAMAMGAMRWVPLKMLPFDNKNELLLVLNFEENTTLERANAVVADFEALIRDVPEVVDYVSYVGTSSPIDFNGLVRHYYLRQMPHQAELRINLVGKKHRSQQSHGIALRLRPDLQTLAEKHDLKLQIVELPPGPPVLASVVAEVYGRPDHSYEELLDAADLVGNRLQREPSIVDVDDIRESAITKLVFEVDQEKAAIAGISVSDIAASVRIALSGDASQVLRDERERHPLRIVFRLPRKERSHVPSLTQLQIKGTSGILVPLAELGTWRNERVSQTIYHKNLRRVVYVFAETAGRPPAECVVDILADRSPAEPPIDRESASRVDRRIRPSGERTYFRPGGNQPWSVPSGIEVSFSGEGEWKITLDVFRDLGLAFGAAMLMIYVILVAQTGSFLVPLVVMLAIPLTVLGVMPGFYLLNQILGQTVSGYADPVYFTATGMIGMIALAGIVTRDSIILVDFTQLAQRRGRPLFDAILESRVVRLRPILLTAGAAMLSSLPITLDPIFSGLGWSLIFGLVASTVFTLFVIPVCYWLLYAGSKPASDTLPAEDPQTRSGSSNT